MAAQASAECTVLVAHNTAADAHDVTFVTVRALSFPWNASPLTVLIRHLTRICCNMFTGDQDALRLDLQQPSEIDSVATLATELCCCPATAYAIPGCSHMHSKLVLLPHAGTATDLLQPQQLQQQQLCCLHAVDLPKIRFAHLPKDVHAHLSVPAPKRMLFVASTDRGFAGWLWDHLARLT